MGTSSFCNRHEVATYRWVVSYRIFTGFRILTAYCCKKVALNAPHRAPHHWQVKRRSRSLFSSSYFEIMDGSHPLKRPAFNNLRAEFVDARGPKIVESGNRS
jgi:hypothetical protein